MRHAARVGAVLLALSIAIAAQDREAGRSNRALDSSRTATIAYADVQPIWDTLRPNLPSELTATPATEMAEAWRNWVRTHDIDIRARVARGDEDSLVNLWLFGTSFTDHPPARPRDIERYGRGATLAQVADGRLADLLEALASPGANDRLRWAGTFLRARNIDPATSRGQERARQLLAAAGKRVVSEQVDYGRTLEAPNRGADPLTWMLPYASLYRDRGLSADTSILSSFAVDTTLDALATSGLIGAGSIRRVAVVGPGLDFINKADGHDFYPEQTIQPFALIDTLLRLGLARAGDLSVTTFDVSARVNGHLSAARDRARAGQGYVVHLPLSGAERWSESLVRYWERAGSHVGEVVKPPPAPRLTDPVRVRAVRVRPDLVMTVIPQDLNIVLERLEPPGAGELFDLVVATNVFVYYDAFEQALAMVNISRMIRPGGSLLSNQAIRPMAPMKPEVGHDTVVYSDRQFDQFFWYQRQ